MMSVFFGIPHLVFCLRGGDVAKEGLELFSRFNSRSTIAHYATVKINTKWPKMSENKKKKNRKEKTSNSRSTTTLPSAPRVGTNCNTIIKECTQDEWRGVQRWMREIKASTSSKSYKSESFSFLLFLPTIF